MKHLAIRDGSRRFWLGGATLLLLLSACRPQGGSQAGAAGEQAIRPKLMRVAIGREPSLFHDGLVETTEASAGLSLLKQIPQDLLVVENDRKEWVPKLSTEQISTDRGTWRVNPDGTMDTVWKLRTNVKWHDGVPFSADDMLFAFNVYKSLPNQHKGTLDKMVSATVEDPYTFSVHWSQPYAFAEEAAGLEPLAKHLLEEAYLRDKDSVVNSPWLKNEFVGLGPYRLVQWTEGSHLEFDRFEDYYLGRPPLDRVIAYVIPDLNTLVANVLAGAVDVAQRIGLDVAAGIEVQNRWEGTGNQVTFLSIGTVKVYEIQHRPEYARPVNGLTNRSVRQALYTALDRHSGAELITAGLGPIADSWVEPGSQLYSQVKPSIPQYPYDPARSMQLLAEAGWVRGTDGILVHQQTGARFELQINGAPHAFQEKLLNFTGEAWKALGIRVTLYPVPNAQMSDREFRATFSGVKDESPGLDQFYTTSLHSSFNASAATRWVGRRAGYANPAVDALVERLWVAIEPGESLNVKRQLLQTVMTDVAVMPLWWNVEPVLAVNGVKGIRGKDGWNFYEWNKE